MHCRSASFTTSPIDGVVSERLASLRAQRQATAAKVVTVYDRSVWADVGANGLSEGEHLLASTWPQRDGVLSGLVPPERVAWLTATAEEHRLRVLHAELERMYGPMRPAPAHTPSSGCGRPIRSRGATRRTGGRVTSFVSGRCTGRTSRRSTSAAPISGSPDTWRAPCERVARPPRRH